MSLETATYPWTKPGVDTPALFCSPLHHGTPFSPPLPNPRETERSHLWTIPILLPLGTWPCATINSQYVLQKLMLTSGMWPCRTKPALARDLWFRLRWQLVSLEGKLVGNPHLAEMVTQWKLCRTLKHFNNLPLTENQFHNWKIQARAQCKVSHLLHTQGKKIHSSEKIIASTWTNKHFHNLPTN